MTKFTLKSKIYVGFAVIVLLLILNGVVSYFGLNRFSKDSELLQSVDSLSSNAQQIDRDVQELRLRVSRYVGSGYDSQRDQAQKIYRRLIDRIESTSKGLDNRKMTGLLEQISSHMSEYTKQFQLVVEERSLREDLVKDKLPSISENVQNQFDDIASSDSPVTDENLLLLTQSQAFFSNAEKSLLRYFETPDSYFVDSAVNSIESAISKIKASTISVELRDQLIDGVQEYERIGLRAVQATRGYLFFLNVVMAGEASEVSYYSQVLREHAEASRQEISDRVMVTSDRVKRVTGVMIPVAIVLSTIIAGRLVFLIVPPITDLTRTFGKLSAGETLHEIPATDRQDEIGKMAKAAQVFNDQNLKTRELLSESKILGDELQVKAAQLEETNQELDSFAYIASHDLKSPLRGIKQLAGWIEEDAGGHLPEASVNHLQVLKSRVSKMETLLEDLLDYSRIGRLAPQSEEVSVSEVMASIADITDNPNEVQVKWAEDLPTFTTLRAPLEQVLLNLVGNAIKHNHRGSDGVVKVDWEKANNGHYQFTVNDNGPGIHEKDHERVFQMYQRVGDPSVEGSGMGLAIVKKQIEHLGGKIELNSTLGEGTSFDFTWPVHPPNTEETH